MRLLSLICGCCSQYQVWFLRRQECYFEKQESSHVVQSLLTFDIFTIPFLRFWNGVAILFQMVVKMSNANKEGHMTKRRVFLYFQQPNRTGYQGMKYAWQRQLLIRCPLPSYCICRRSIPFLYQVILAIANPPSIT